MNAFRGKSLADQADAARKQAELDAIQKNASLGGADLYSTPEGQSVAGAYDISPETTGQIYESSPNRQLRMALSELTQKYQGQQIPNAELENAYLAHTGTLPTGLSGYMGRQVTADTAGKRITAQNLQKMTADMVAAQKASQSAGDDEPTQRRKAEEAAGPLLAVLSAEQRKAVDAELEKAREGAQGKGPSGVPAARQAELGARATAETARAKYLDKLTSEADQKAADAHGLSDLRRDILTLRKQILAAQGAGGVLKPTDRARILTQIAALETKKAARLNIAGFELTPEAKAEGPALMKTYQGAIDELKGMLASKPAAPTGAAPAASAGEGGWQEGDTVDYPDGKSLTLKGGQWVPS
jgi:hypothetical protein